MTTATSSEVDFNIDEIVMEALRAHRQERRIPGGILCLCGSEFTRHRGKSATVRHTKHQAWAIAQAIREEGYVYDGNGNGG